MFVTAVLRSDDGESLGIIVMGPKVFKSGKPGWHGQGKIEIEGVRYQAQSQLVRIAGQEGEKE